MINIFFHFSCIKDDNTCYIIVSDANYPHILAYSFLDELKNEFSLLYSPSIINNVKRPYGFIEFGKFINESEILYLFKKNSNYYEKNSISLQRKIVLVGQKKKKIEINGAED